MKRVLTASALYFLIVFSAGFGLGVVRELVLRPSIGALAAVLAEIPLMLAISWIAAGWVLRRVTLGVRAEAAVAGVAALALLLASEAILFQVVTGRPAINLARDWLTLQGGAGLAAQLIFAAFPVIRWRATHDY